MEFWKQAKYFTRSERYVLSLCAVILLLPLAFMAGGFMKGNSDGEEGCAEDTLICQPTDSDSAYHHRRYAYSRRDTTPVVLRPFDPNTADSATLVSLGLKPWMARNILKYRARGGRFRKADDFARVYGLEEGQFEMLRPFITISGEASRPARDTIRLLTISRDSLAKYPEGTLLPINLSDTAELKLIPGVGSGIARMIVGYRNRLGGFYSVDQLAEIHLRVDILRQWLVEDTMTLRKININRSSVAFMSHHPYISRSQAAAIYEYRRKRGDISSLDDIRLLDEFSESDIERLSHYVSF